MPLESTRHGLLARAGDYEPLRAFSQGGCYWDEAPQKLVRESGLAEFLPPVETESDDRGKFGRFHREHGQRELLSRSKPLGRRRIPPDQLRRLKQAIDDFQLKAHTDRVQQHNRELIERFQLPDLDRNPELYRLVGPWWNRRLQVLWGCERARDSSLPAAVAAEKLEEDTLYNLRRVLGGLLLLLLLLLPAWWWRQSNAPERVRREPAIAPAESSPADRTKALAESAEAEAKKAQADAAQARADAERVRKEAEQSKAEAARKAQAAAEAAAAAERADEKARQARAAADQAQAQANAGAGQRGGGATSPRIVQPQPGAGAAPPGTSPVGQKEPSGPQSAATSRAPAGAGPGSETPERGTQPSTPNNLNQPAAGAPVGQRPAVQPRYEIVLTEPGRQGPNGSMDVSLEVRSDTDPQRALPVEAWYFDDQSVKSEERLQTSLGGGDHLIRAVVLDAAGKRSTVEAVITVEPGKVVRTGGKVSLRPKTAP